VADNLFNAEVDASRVLAAFKTLGQRALPAVESASYQTALAVKETARKLIRSRPPAISRGTANSIGIEKRQIGGYAVLMADVVREKETARRRSLGMKNARSKLQQDLHVGIWLEWGTRHSRRFPFLFPAAGTQEGAHLNRLANSLQNLLNGMEG